MSKFIDLTGKTFGSLKILRLHSMDKKYGSRWVCECVCGKEHVVLAINLKAGEVKSCGCQHIINARKLHLDNLEGKRFGKLLVVKRDNDYVDPHNNHRPKWLCLCDCGNEKSVLATSLKNESVNSCGCSKIENLEGEKFGNLNPIKLIYSPKKIVKWLCKCDCGNEVVVLSDSLKSGKSTSCGCLKESRIAMDLKEFFTKNYNSTMEYKILKNPETNRWLPYDIYIPCGANPDINGFYIEVHGEQHYKFIPYWHKTKEKFEHNKKIDKLKKKFAKKNGTYIEIDLRKIKTTVQAIEHIESLIT